MAGQVGLRPASAPHRDPGAEHRRRLGEHKLYLERGKALAAWHRNVPAFFTFDDHEILDNVDGTSVVGRRNRKAVFRDIGAEAWYDYLGWANPIAPGKIHFGQAQLKAGSDILTDPQADFSTLGPEALAPGELHVNWGGVAAGVPERELAGLPGVRGRSERQRLPDPRTDSTPIAFVVRPAAQADGVATYSIARKSYLRTAPGQRGLLLLIWIPAATGA